MLVLASIHNPLVHTGVGINDYLLYLLLEKTDLQLLLPLLRYQQQPCFFVHEGFTTMNINNSIVTLDYSKLYTV